MLEYSTWPPEGYLEEGKLHQAGFTVSSLSFSNSTLTKGHCSHSHNSLMTEIRRGEEEMTRQRRREVRDGPRGKRKVTERKKG